MRRTVSSVLVGLAAVIGCGRGGVVEERAEQPSAPAETAGTSPAAHLDWNQPFDQAASPVGPAGSLPPPERTLSGKPTAALQLAVRKAWGEVKFTETDGKPDPVRVVLDTDAGEVEFTLFPDAAPNHVRNFLALAKAGYYDGLVFERIVRQEAVAADGTPLRIEFLTAGCPAGEGEPGQGHIGYFLKPEFSDLPHEEGTVGFWHEQDDDSAGTRFYVTLGPCPGMDGRYTVIGKVSRGMEVLHRIAERRTREPDFERPVVPAVIRQAEVRR
jgi:peptidyl-prolyl cis-trans isomerase B (cyclophilin B)